MKGKDCVVSVTQKKCPDVLIDQSAMTHMFKVTKTLGMCMTGKDPDIRNVVQKARKQAAEFRFEYGYEIQWDVLANKNGRRVSGVHATRVHETFSDDVYINGN